MRGCVPLSILTWHPAPWPLVAAGWVVLSAWTIWTYRRQTAIWLMPAARVTAITTIALAALRPTIRRAAMAVERGPVVFLIDASASMSVVDNGRPAAQWVAITAALGRLPSGTRDDQTVRLQHDCDRLSAVADDVAQAKAAVDYAALAGRSTDAAKARLDQSLVELHDQAKAVGRELSGIAGSGPLSKTLGLLSTFGDGTYNVRDLARSAAGQAEQARLATDGQLFRVNPAVRAACGPVSSLSRVELATAAVFDPSRGLIAGLPSDQRNVVYTVADDLAVTTGGPINAAGTATAFGDAVRAVLEDPAEPPRAVVVLSDGRQTVGLEPAGAAGGAVGVDRVPVFTIGIGARVPPRDLSIASAVAPLSAYVGEPFDVTAQVKSIGLGTSHTTIRIGDQVRPITVSDDKPATATIPITPTAGGPLAIDVEVEPVAGEATTANNRVRRWVKVFDHHTRVSTVGSSGDRISGAAGADPSAQRPSTQPTDGLSAAAIESAVDSADVVIVFDGGASLSADQAERIERAVVERGASLVVVPGEATSTTRATWSFAPPPRPWRHWPGRRPGFKAVAVGEGSVDPPPFGRYTPLPPDGRVLIEESETDVPVLVERSVGRGRVLTLGIGDFEGDPTRFWADLIRLAADEPYLVTTDAGAIDVDPVAARPGRPVTVRARAAGRSCDLRILRDGEPVRDVPMTSVDGRFVATVDDLPAGRYEFRAGPSVPVVVESTTEKELADLSSDESTLRRLAESTGGRFFRLDQLESASRRLAELPDVSPPVDRPVWDSSAVVAIVVGCLLLEWAMRKRAGLV